MIPVVTPAEMAAIDAAAPEPVEVLIERAGAAVARAATRMMGGTYGRRVVVLAGKGNNGNDGRAMLEKFGLTNQANVTITADPGPRTGEAKIKQFAGLPLSWIPTTLVYKGGDLRYALNYGEIRFPVLQQFLADSESEWSHTGEPKLAE